MFNADAILLLPHRGPAHKNGFVVCYGAPGLTRHKRTSPMSGLPPAPRPRVSWPPIWILLEPATGDAASACGPVTKCTGLFSKMHRDPTQCTQSFIAGWARPMRSPHAYASKPPVGRAGASVQAQEFDRPLPTCASVLAILRAAHEVGGHCVRQDGRSGLRASALLRPLGGKYRQAGARGSPKLDPGHALHHAVDSCGVCVCRHVWVLGVLR